MQSLLDSFESAEGACEGPEPVTLAAAPEIAPLVRSAAREIAGGDAAGEDTCARLEVASDASIEVLNAVQSGETPPDLWIPATSNRLRELPDRAEDRRTWWFATSPVALVGRPDAARPGTWLSALSSDGARMLDPRSSASGLAVLAAVNAEAVAGVSTGTALSSWLASAASRSSETSDGPVDATGLLASASVGRQGAPTWFPLSEQQFLSQVDGSADGNVRLQVPKSGSVLLDFPMVSLADGERGELANSAGDALVDYLNTSEGAKLLADAGFRTESGMPIEGSGDVGRVSEMTTMQAARVGELVQLWTTLSLDARMLAVIDVSDSMTAVEFSRSRIEIARDALLGALAEMPESWHLGLWVYSIGLGDRGEDFRRLVTAEPLGGEGSAQRTQLLSGIAELPDLVGGGTGLFDTALAAFRSARADYEPDAVNSVVILTDGRNEDTDGIGLERLLDTLRREYDRDRPVRLITIGMGDDADTATLARISAATDARTYTVRDAEDIHDVLTTELLERVGWSLN